MEMSEDREELAVYCPCVQYPGEAEQTSEEATKCCDQNHDREELRCPGSMQPCNEFRDDEPRLSGLTPGNHTDRRDGCKHVKPRDAYDGVQDRERNCSGWLL